MVSGVITAMVTPFDEGGQLDAEAARRLARHLAEHGSHGLVLAGTTGESPTLDDAEKLELLAAVRDELGDELTLILGTGSNDTRHSVELTRAAVDAGADAVLVVTPYYNKPNRAGLRGHVEAVAEAAGETPVVLYNIPSRCVINMPPDLLAELAPDRQRRRGQAGEQRRARRRSRASTCWPATTTSSSAASRWGDRRHPRRLAPGRAADPRDLRRGDERASSTARARSRRRSGTCYEALTVTANPIPVKAGAGDAGLIGGALRLPMVEADEEQRSVVRTALERQGLLATSAS